MDLEKLKEEQQKLAKKVMLTDGFKSYKTIAGVDQVTLNDTIISAIVICDAKTHKILEKKYSIYEAKFPYLRGYLSYRESPAIVETYNKLKTEPDILIVKGHGVLHPRRIGLTSHVGILLNKPTIGIAKNLLCGNVREGDVYIDKEILGKQIKIKRIGKPILVSPGHMISLKTSIEIVKSLAKEPYKMPLPLALAHKEAMKIKAKLKEKAEKAKKI